MSTNDVASATAISPTGRDGLWARVIAGIYDPFLWLGERAGLRSRRGELLAQARGRVVEIGAGTGLNLEHYPATVEELVLTEPAEAGRPGARAVARRAGRRLRGTRRGAYSRRTGRGRFLCDRSRRSTPYANCKRTVHGAPVTAPMTRSLRACWLSL